jgi:hypothetical protein
LNEKSEEVMLMYDMNRNLFWSHSVHYKKLFECNQLLPIFFWRTKLWRNKQEVEGYAYLLKSELRFRTLSKALL